MKNRETIFSRIRTSLASMYTAVASWTGISSNAYPSLDPTRKEVFNGWRPRNILPNELAASLGPLSAQCAHIERFTPQGAAVCHGLVADIVGSGIDVLPQSGSPELDTKLHKAWTRWAEEAITDGRSLWEWQAQVVRDICVSGSSLARWVTIPGTSGIPYKILPLDTSWLTFYPLRPISPDNVFVRGIEVDKYGRALRYHLANPDTNYTKQAGEVVEASEMIYIFEVTRAGMVHGVPILAPTIERLLQDSRLVETELKASITTAAPAVAITSAAGGYVDGNEVDEDSEPITDIPAGAVSRLEPGETITTIQNNRPSQQIAPFRTTIRGDIAGACRVSQFWLDRDPSRANYASMRMDQLLTKRCLIGLKYTIGRGAAGKVYQKMFEWFLLEAGITMPSSSVMVQLMQYELRPDQPEYVDPLKDVNASLTAVDSKLSSLEIELSSRGKDWRQVIGQSEIEAKAIDASNAERIGWAIELAAKLSTAYGLSVTWTDIIGLSKDKKTPAPVPPTHEEIVATENVA